MRAIQELHPGVSGHGGVHPSASILHTPEEYAGRLRELVRTHPQVELPGGGDTLARWRLLADVAAEDVVLVKLFEAHLDAVAILAELDPAHTVERLLNIPSTHSRPTDAAPPVWAVWAAEPPDARVFGERISGELRLRGRKAWCSGAALVSHALVTYFDESSRPCLAAVSLDAPGVSVTNEGWHAVGMSATASVDVCFSNVKAAAVGGPGAYLERPGFWQGGAGIAACWYGAALPFATLLRDRQARRSDPHGQAHLGGIDVRLHQARSLARETAAWIDAHPLANAQAPAMRLRAAIESMALEVVHAASRAFGAGPLCRDAAVARRFADLPVFLRQSHAEKDLAAIGALLTERASEEASWNL